MTTDLIEISKAEVIEKARALLSRFRQERFALRPTKVYRQIESELFAAVTLLESREAMRTEEEK